MDDDGHDDFISIGQPLIIPSADTGLNDDDSNNDPEPNKWTPAWQQEVRDEQGRRRFHGAFTGGFSAGFYNTVGSAEGWTPTTFHSSRHQRTERKQQRIEDYMDDEDLQQLRGEVTASGVFSRPIHAKGEVPSDLAPFESRADRVLADAIAPVRDPIGIRLLKAMGWRPGQGIGPRRRRPEQKGLQDVYASMHVFAPENTRLPLIQEALDERRRQQMTVQVVMAGQTVKKQFKGLGFTENKVSLKPLQAQQQQGGQVKGLGVRGTAFGVGVFEDDDEDIYGGSDLKAFMNEIRDEEEDEAVSKKKKSKHAVFKPPVKTSTIPGFQVSDRPLFSVLVFDGPRVPLNFVPNPTFEQRKVARPLDLSADQRGQMLSEPLVTSSTSKEEASVVTSEDPRTWPGLPSEAAQSALKGFLPFASDPSKKERYIAFLKFHAKEGPLESYQRLLPSRMRSTERMQEWNEFRQAAMIFQPLSGAIADRFVIGKNNGEDGDGTESKEERLIKDKAAALAAKNEVKCRREVKVFMPSRLLCKRFNVPNPYPDGSALPTFQLNVQTNVPETFMSLPKEATAKSFSVSLDGAVSRGRDVATQMIIKRAEDPIPQRSGDLEQNIYGDVLSSDDEDGEEEVTVEQPTKVYGVMLPPADYHPPPEKEEITPKDQASGDVNSRMEMEMKEPVEEMQWVEKQPSQRSRSHSRSRSRSRSRRKKHKSESHRKHKKKHKKKRHRRHSSSPSRSRSKSPADTRPRAADFF